MRHGPALWCCVVPVDSVKENSSAGMFSVVGEGIGVLHTLGESFFPQKFVLHLQLPWFHVGKEGLGSLTPAQRGPTSLAADAALTVHSGSPGLHVTPPSTPGLCCCLLYSGWHWTRAVESCARPHQQSAWLEDREQAFLSQSMGPRVSVLLWSAS